MQIFRTTKWTWKKLLIIFLCLILVIIIRPVFFLAYVDYNDRNVEKKITPGQVNDASNLNKTSVFEVVKVEQDLKKAIVQISALIKEAGYSGKKISIAGSQHSMGGHTIYPNGIILDMKAMNHMEYDSVTGILTAGSGAIWAEVISFLDRRGKSVAVMQSNNSFTVGGSVSVNCHGWTPNKPPISSTIKSFRLLNAKGELIQCSRSENSELFSVVLGGYGLFGVIVDVQLQVVDNAMYKTTQYVMNSRDYIKMFNQHVKNNQSAGMAYGRINVSKDKFMEEAILSVYTLDTSANLKPLKKQNQFSGLRRTVFRGSVNSDYGKKLRWRLEKGITFIITGREFSRNQLINEGVEVFQNRDSNYSDILQEYFIPVNQVNAFIDSLKKLIPVFSVDLLNITLRDVKKDEISFLNYAKQDVIGFVMLFSQQLNIDAESEMAQLTRKLIDVSMSLNGTYYLPYRLHASKTQFMKAYPEEADFFLLKNKYDSLGIFQNQFYKAYKN